jgi:Tfp pilus assembly protein PilZ
MFRRLRLDFYSLEDFQREYQAYVEHGELFVPTHQELGLREVIDLELGLSFCGRVVTLQAEVRGYRNWREENRRRGVSLRLLEPIENLRLALADATGLMFPPTPTPAAEPAAAVAAPAPEASQPAPSRAVPGAPAAQGSALDGARRAERSLARVTVTAESEGASREGTTADLSHSGALLELEGEPPPVGTALTLVMFHPTTDHTIELRGRVVRHADMPSGDVGVGVQFDFSQSDEEASRRFLDEVRAIDVDPRRRTETISGSIDVLGLPTLVQMFSASVNEGTITLVRGQDRGRVVFSGGTLRYARTADVTGLKALCRLLGWQTGVFHFAPNADVEEETDEMPMMHRALFECIQKLDELGRLDISGFPLHQRVLRTSEPADEVEPLERQVLTFIKDGATVRDVIDGVPAFDVEIYLALEKLLEHELIDIDI